MQTIFPTLTPPSDLEPPVSTYDFLTWFSNYNYPILTKDQGTPSPRFTANPTHQNCLWPAPSKFLSGQHHQNCPSDQHHQNFYVTSTIYTEDKVYTGDVRDARDARDTRDTIYTIDARDTRDTIYTRDARDARDARDVRYARDTIDTKSSNRRRFHSNRNLRRE
ncbi:hypothetical protein BDF21DRAFT_400481 [Thamnidium elegans]|nr:hypothetical protein BDF21DRAFT_400481 [Thamnidium elegans]